MGRVAAAVFWTAILLCGCGGGGGGGGGGSNGPPPNVRFVAPTGSDENPGTLDQPYRTIQKCATTIMSGATCAVRAGTYRETVTPNSGSTITSYNGEPVTIDGSDPIAGWTEYQGAIYKASVNMPLADGNQVFVGNQMMTEAQWPNGNDLFHVNWATLAAGTTSLVLVDPQLPNINWTGAKVHFWSGFDPNHTQTATITSSASGQLDFTFDGISGDPGVYPTPGGYYYLFRLLSALDTPHEWYYDPAAQALYFWAPGGVNPATLDVRVKRRQLAFDLSGLANVTISHINLFASTIQTTSTSTHITLDGIGAKYVSHFTDLVNPPGLPNYFTLHAWDTGVIIYGSNNVLKNSVVEWSAGNGVALAGDHNTVANNLIDHVDYMGVDPAGINLSGFNQTVQHNTIYSAGRFGIFLSQWYNGSGIGPPNLNDIDVSYNNIFNSEMLSTDAGEVYAFGQQGYGPVSGSAIHHNWLHDTVALYAGQSTGFPLPGVYFDLYVTGWNVYQNILWNNEYTNIFVNGGTGSMQEPNQPPENISIYNNSIPDIGADAEILLADISNCGSAEIRDNLVLVPIQQNYTATPCPATGNGSTAAGANEMSASTPVGCNFSGCASEPPPTISSSMVSPSIPVQPYDIMVAAGQTGTFTVRGAGSSPLSYQWLKNGSAISGATGSSYTTAVTTTADSGAVFSVTVSNSLGTVSSNSAKLTVE